MGVWGHATCLRSGPRDMSTLPMPAGVYGLQAPMPVITTGSHVNMGALDPHIYTVHVYTFMRPVILAPIQACHSNLHH